MLSSRHWHMTDAYAPTKRADRVADWIETRCLALNRAVGADALNEAGQPHGYKAADVDLGLRTMARRSAAVGKAYPFRVSGGAASLERASQSVWAAMLLMSGESPLRSTLDLAEAAAHLERVSAAAARFLLGPGTQAVRFGWPSEDGRPVEFPEAVRWLAGLMGVPVGSAYRPPVNKDGGVDVVAWRPFPDGSPDPGDARGARLPQRRRTGAGADAAATEAARVDGRGGAAVPRVCAGR